MRCGPAALLFLVAGCSRPDPWAPCRDGDPGFGANTCFGPSCDACQRQLHAAWDRRSTPAGRADFHVHFLRSSAGARDRFVREMQPPDDLVLQHCTVGPVRGASCAALPETCVAYFDRALRSGATSVPLRTQMNLAVDAACEAPRNALVTRLGACGDGLDVDGCTSDGCRACTAGRLAALALLAPAADQPERRDAFDAFVRGTPEPVARTIAESLGAPDAPVDLDPVVVRRGAFAYCVDLLGHSARALPYACGSRLGTLLTHPEYARDFPRAWGALEAAAAPAAVPTVDVVVDLLARDASPSAAVLARLDALPPARVVAALRRAVDAPTTTPAAAAALRARLERLRGVAPTLLPTPAPPPSAATEGMGPMG